MLFERLKLVATKTERLCKRSKLTFVLLRSHSVIYQFSLNEPKYDVYLTFIACLVSSVVFRQAPKTQNNKHHLKFS